MKFKNNKVAIIGLGYVGLPLAVEFSKKFTVVGFDINKDRIKDLNKGFDKTNEITRSDLINLKNISFSFAEDSIKNSDIYIITVPTPVDKNNAPDLTPLTSATKLVAKYIIKNDIVIYESTVYPGCTEEFCVPLLEKESGLTYNKDFFVDIALKELIQEIKNIHSKTFVK